MFPHELVPVDDIDDNQVWIPRLISVHCTMDADLTNLPLPFLCQLMS